MPRKRTCSARRKDGNNLAFPFPKFRNRSVGDNSNGDQDIKDQRCDTGGKDKPNNEVIPTAENPNPVQWSECIKIFRGDENAPVQEE